MYLNDRYTTKSKSAGVGKPLLHVYKFLLSSDFKWNTAHGTNMSKKYTLQLHDIILGPFKHETSLKYILYSVLALRTYKAGRSSHCNQMQASNQVSRFSELQNHFEHIKQCLAGE